VERSAYPNRSDLFIAAEVVTAVSEAAVSNRGAVHTSGWGAPLEASTTGQADSMRVDRGRDVHATTG
jgi:hypothetical protein